jgi:hypothetical protein
MANLVGARMPLRGQVFGGGQGALFLDPLSGAAYLLNAAAVTDATNFKTTNGFPSGWSSDPALVGQFIAQLKSFATSNFDPAATAPQTLVAAGADVATVGSALVTVVSAGSWQVWIVPPNQPEPIASAQSIWQENRNIQSPLHMRGTWLFAGGSPNRWAMFLHPSSGDVFLLDWAADQAAMVWARDKQKFDPKTWQTNVKHCDDLHKQFLAMADPAQGPASPGRTWRFPGSYVASVSAAFAACTNASTGDPL